MEPMLLLLIGGVLVFYLALYMITLRLAVSLYNLLTGKRATQKRHVAGAFASNIDAYFERLGNPNPYAAPQTSGPAPGLPSVTGGVPVPTLGRAFCIVLVVVLANAVASFLIGLASVPIRLAVVGSASVYVDAVAVVVALVAEFFVTVYVLNEMLPTRGFGGAAAVLLLQVMLGILVAVVIAAAVAGVMMATGEFENVRAAIENHT